jgi:hypothetical protein
MRRRPYRDLPRLAGLLALPVAVSAAFAAAPAGALATPHPRSGVAARQATRVARYWTPARMRAARPLDLVVGRDGSSRLRVGAPGEPAATASFVGVKTPEAPPYSVEGRVFIRRGKLEGFCSGTAIDSPTRQLVLTAGHCVNSGREGGRPSVYSSYLEFVPAYTGGVAPFGTFVARRNTIRAPQQWVGRGNPDFDVGAFLTRPNSAGVNLADAVGGGATIVTDLSRHQTFQTFGYPGTSKYMKGCTSPYLGDDLLSDPLPGPPTMAIRCRWAPGASGGGWLIAGGTEIDGINTYLHLGDSSGRTYGPYFSAGNVGKLVKGL